MEVKPRFVTLKSNYNQKYLAPYVTSDHNPDRLTFLRPFGEQLAKCSGAIFELELSQVNKKMVNIRCCHNKKYLRRKNSGEWWIVAEAENPNDKLSSWSCTNFEVIQVGDVCANTFRLRHSQLGHYAGVRTDLPSNHHHYLCLDAKYTWPANSKEVLDVFTVTDLEPPLPLPRFVAFKSNHNQKYLVPYVTSDHNPQRLTFLRPFGEQVVSPGTMFEVELSHVNKNMVNIRSCHNKKYLRRKNSGEWWIVAEAENSDDKLCSWSCTNFEVIKVGANTFRLRHAQLGHFAGVRTDLPSNHHHYLCLDAKYTWSADSNQVLDVFTVVTDLEPPLPLPRFVAFKSNHNQKYLVTYVTSDHNPQRLTFLRPFGEQMVSPGTMFEVELSHVNKNMVNIRSCHNKKYLRRKNSGEWWIVAEAENPDDKLSSWSCTNFEVIQVGNVGANTFRLRHAQLGHFAGVRTDLPCNHHHYLCLDAKYKWLADSKEVLDVFTVTDLGPPLALPRFVAFKSNQNQKYLVPYVTSDHNPERLTFLRPFGEQMARADAMFEVELSQVNRKMVNIRCCHNNKYLRRKNSGEWWIVAEAKDPDDKLSSWSCTNFEVIQVGDGCANTFRLRHAQLGNFAGVRTDLPCNHHHYLCLDAKYTWPADSNQVLDVFTAIPFKSCQGN